LGAGLLLYVCVTVMRCYSTVGYRVTVMCVCYCNVFATVELGTGLLLYVCVTVMCCYSTVGHRVSVICVCYCNVLLQYSWTQCH
jgi:hypothetical protein